MKKIYSLFILLCSITVSSQTVTINVTGNRNKQIAVDGRYYTINNQNLTAEQEVVINDLSVGQHTLLVSRSNLNNNKTTSVNTSFNLREGFDLKIQVNSGGAVTLTEKRNGRGNDEAISNAAFNKLYNSTKSKTSSSSRTSFLENEFTKTEKRFTSKQASQLIQLVNTEKLRLALAKNAYLKVVDKENYSLVRNLLSSSSNRSNLDAYIASVPADEDDESTVMTPISNQQFQNIYSEVMAETNSADRNYYLANFFGKEYNYYTSWQARQLVALVSQETDRLSLAKTAYRGITDKTQYDQVVQLLSSNYNRSELKNYIAVYDQNNNTGVAMSSAVFNKLYNSIYIQNSSSARYNSVNTAFTTTGNYFTATQARQLIALVNSETNRLLLAKAAYRTLTDKNNYTVMNDLFTSQVYRNDLADYVYTINNTGPGAGVAMSETQFNNLYSGVSNTWSASARFNLVTTAFQGTENYFTAAQVKQLLTLISSESDRLALAKNAFDNLTDRTNYTLISDLFTSTTYKNEWARFALESSGGTWVKTPMTETAFTTVYRNVQYTFGIGAKMSSLTELFNTETNYFTVQQTKQLIQLVSLESNRLELAKSAYNNITDPANFTQLYDIFSSQSSKDELNAYISNAYMTK